MAIREGRWDCSNCLTKRIKGRLKNCPQCNDPRNPAVSPEEKPYLPDDAEVVTDPDLIELANAGPDWHCGHCGEANRGDRKTCASCDRPRSGDDVYSPVTTYVGGKSAAGVKLDEAERADPTYPDEMRSAEKLIAGDDDPDQPVTDTLPESVRTRDGAIAQRVDGYEEQMELNQRLRDGGALPVIWESHRTKIIATGAVAVGIALVVLVASMIHQATATKAVTLEVMELSWSRSVEIEQYRTLREQGWSVPSGGRMVRSFQDIHHYDKVFSHNERVARQVPYEVQDPPRTESYACGSRTVDKGNGFFDTETQYCDRTVSQSHTEYRTEYENEAVYKDVPVYQTRYEFDIDRWVHDRWVNASGRSSEFGPEWPEPGQLLENQRLGAGRQQEYRVKLVDENGKSYSRETAFSNWRQLRKGGSVVGHVTNSGKLKSVDWVKVAA